MSRSTMIVLLALALSGCRSAESSGPPAKPPKLVVAILVDGLGQHQVTRFRQHLGQGGFRRLLDQGAWFDNANYGHSTTITAVGHGTWMTGAHPYRHGMVSNDWYDRKTKKVVYCTEDSEARNLGEATKVLQGTSPKNLFVSTLGDELRLATAFKSRVFSVSLKDRGAILPAGRLGTPYFYSATTGRFITSDFYMQEFPKWWSDFEYSKPQDKWFGKEWTPLLPDAAYEGTVENQPYVANYKGNGRKFPHKVTGGKPTPGPEYYAAIEGTPFGHEYLAEFSKTLIRQEGIGRNPADVPDLFTISFSSHDFINHLFGPESKESEDDLLRLDRILADFFAFLDEWVGLDRTLITLTADHGFSYSPEYWRDVIGLEAYRVNAQEMLKRLNAHLSERFGLGKYAAFWRYPTVWLDYDLIYERRLQRADVENAAAQYLSTYPGVHSVFTRTQLSEGRVPPTALGLRVSRAWHPRVSGDLLLVPKDGSFFSEGILLTFAASHGSPWAYDTRVPLIFLGSSWFRPGCYPQDAQVADMAPTLAHLLTVPPPSGNEGRALAEILK
ncbi:MAG TPA: alkaline phosphatase family protein [Planctomycetota bacterium]|nr:alkaline phosphatase family protein [Planctomycetota bacterium]